jgi:hypothetical protein
MTGMPDFMCAVCGCPNADHDADENGEACAACGDCPGYRPGEAIDDVDVDPYVANALAHAGWTVTDGGPGVRFQSMLHGVVAGDGYPTAAAAWDDIKTAERGLEECDYCRSDEGCPRCSD